ncbi:hypothetical protein PENCOP_c005G00758 [Penicillium coprophilum]|uniref:Uncharacterized protein n=1 Tax=Penicillium coprophilum TaxID=36646 RepID=A0A1V6US55_9EURO|nr:hypothetical protein PENCOP_c005G00758 [Penicillium coprophilum]
MMKDPSKDSTFDDECHDAIEKFFEDLSADESDLFEATTRSQQLIDDLQNIDNSQKGKISRRIAPKLKAFIAGVEQYGGALDVVAGSVSMMSPIWASVRVVLKVAGEYSEYFDKISDMFEEIGYILSCLRRYPRLYGNNQVLRDSMVEIFQSIMQFCSRARDLFHQGKKYQSGVRALNPVGLHAAWRLIWKPYKIQFGDIVERIRSSMVRIDHEADVAEKELASKERSKAEHERQLQASRWVTLESHQKSVAQFIDQQRIEYVNQWLLPVNAASNHTSATKLRHQGTGHWFLDGPKFREWALMDNSFLWLHAIPGAGKTILPSSVIEWLRDKKQSRDVALAYFYCDYKDKQKQSPTRIISTLLSMLASRNDDVFERIQAFFQRQYKENPAYAPEFDELLNNFSHFMGGSFQQIFIVVDALDESEDRECVAYSLKKIYETCQFSNIFVTSRHEIDIARTYDGLTSVTIEATDVAGDIDIYVKAEVAAKIKARKLKLRDSNLAGIICDTLIAGARGMFQWVKCQIDQLCKLRTDKAVRNALNDLPKTLHDTYFRILQKVDSNDSEDVKMVRRLLKWLVHGVRNLPLGELAECVSVDIGNSEGSFDFDAVFTDAEDVVELCGSLVTLSSGGYVALAHYTVKEFLVSDAIRETMPQFWIGYGDAHAELASVCLTYLTYDDFSGTKERSGKALLKTFDEYKFLPYAVQAWGTHAHFSDFSDDVFDLTMRLLESETESGGNYHTWCHIFFHLQKSSDQRLKTSNNSPLYFASFFGLHRAVSLLLDGSADVDMEDSMIASASGGHESVIKVFLDQVDSIEAVVLEKCLYVGAGQGHESVVKLLLERRMNFHTRSGRNGTALQIATLNGRHHVVSLLLANRADVDVTCQRYGVPLAAAAEKGHFQTFQILLDHGANVNGRGGWYAYPLVSAIVGRNMQMINALIEQGANLNALGGRHGCALMAASSMGMLDLIQSLVSKGAKVNDENDKGMIVYVNAKGGKHRNALNAASAGGHVKIVQCLLNAGADVEFFDEHYGNSLQMAAFAGHTEVVRLLAEVGVDVNATSADRGTALVSAAQNGHTEIVRLLFELGVPTGDTYEMSNAIMVAANKGHIEVVKVLVEMGAVTEDCSTISTYPCCTPLEAAALKGNLDMVRLLLDLGADVNFINDKKYGTPLIAACRGQKSSIAVAEFLLESGADINASADSDDMVFCALGAALKCENYDLCVVLLDRGADVNAVNDCYPTPLLMAVVLEHEKFMNLLFDHGADVNLAIQPLENEDEDEDDTDTRGDFITALQCVVERGSNERVQYLLQKGADLSVTIEDAMFCSALQAACFVGDVDKIQILIDAGSDVNQVGGLYGTNLQVAASQGHQEAVAILIEAGGDIHVSEIGKYGSALMAAIEKGHDVVTQLLVNRGVDVNCPIGSSRSEYPLTAAATHGRDKTCQILLDAGSNVNNKGGIYATALQAAAAEGNDDTIPLLLEHGADPNIVGGKFGTALQAAYASGYYVIISCLLDAGASVHLEGGQYGTALSVALENSCATLVSALLRHHGANPNTPVRKYGTPLQQCIRWREDDNVFDILLDVGADVNAQGGIYGNPLICAVVHTEDAVSALLEAGADVNLGGNATYPTPAHAAAERGRLWILRLLSEKGADLKNSNGESGSLVEYASSSCDNFSVFSYLIRRGAAIEPTGKGKYHNALQAASLTGNKAIVKALLRCGFDINTTGGKFGTALTAAIVSDNLDIARLLLKKGIDPNATGAASGSIGGVRLLLKYGANIHRTGGKYSTVLQAASVSGNYEVVELLLEKGAELNSLGGYCHSALHAAALYDRAASCELLLKNGAHWSLVDRKPSHLGQWRLDHACKILQDCWERQERGWPKEDSDSEESDFEGDQIDDETPDGDQDDDKDDSDDDTEDEEDNIDEEEKEDSQDDFEEDKAWKLNVEEISMFDFPYRPSATSWRLYN